VRFNSFEFAVFMVVLLALVPLFPRGRPRHWLLLAASYVFYGSWNWWFLGLLWISTLLDWHCGFGIARADQLWKKRAWLWASLVGNLGILFYFKYGNFFFENVAFVSGIDPEPFYLDVVIPLGISFYTFQTMTYTIDVYRGTQKPCASLLDFALYVTFFPQLVAGPILRAGDFLPQLERTSPVRDDEIVTGTELFCLGLFKKVVVADNMALLADRVFADPDGYSGAAVLLATTAFWIQIYCDFSGYSTMARGLGMWFGYDLPKNFDYPMLRTNPVEYRRAWHMTMGQWFTDYVYKPLGGSRVGDWSLVRNIMITWTLTGLWHGASWHFVIWGAYNGVTLTVYSLVMRHKSWSIPDFPGKMFVAWLIQVALLLPSAALFRVADMGSFLSVLERIFTWAPGRSVAPEWAVAIAALAALHWLFFFKYEEGVLTRLRWPLRIGVVGIAAAAIACLAATGRPFIYFQF
jgi:D-alanyl-lipoteichoic acid acyltransferase DltB (MBOAT superfamily)